MTILYITKIKNRQLKFRKKLILNYLVFVAIFSVVNSLIIGFYITKYKQKYEKIRFLNFSDSTAYKFDYLFKKYINRFPLRFHIHIKDALLREKSLKNLLIVDVNGNVFYSYKSFYENKKPKKFNNILNLIREVKTIEKFYNGKLYIIKPIIEDDGSHTFSIVYVFETSNFLKNFFISSITMFLINTIISFGFFVVSLKLARQISTSVEDLSLFAKGLKNKNFSMRLRIKSGDEFEELSNVMSEMAEEIENSFKREKELRLFLQSIIDNSPFAIAIYDNENATVLKNPAFKSLSKKIENLTEEFLKLIHKSDGEGIIKINEYVLRYVLYGVGKRYRVSVLFDITESYKAKERLIISQKIETVGIFASGIVHDIKNMISVISGYTELLEKQADNKIKNYLKNIKGAIEEIKSLSYNLLHFAKGGEKKPVETSEIIKEVKKLVSGSLKGKVKTIYKEYSNAKIIANKEEIKQVLINLILNAFDAVKGRKDPEILITVDKEIIKNHTILKKGSYIKFSVKDNGIGIPEEIVSKIFDPFFTTKKKKGSGLGLFSSYTIIRRHGGTIDVETKENQGSTFKVYIPCEKQ